MQFPNFHVCSQRTAQEIQIDFARNGKVFGAALPKWMQNAASGARFSASDIFVMRSARPKFIKNTDIKLVENLLICQQVLAFINLESFAAVLYQRMRERCPFVYRYWRKLFQAHGFGCSDCHKSCPLEERHMQPVQHRPQLPR